MQIVVCCAKLTNETWYHLTECDFASCVRSKEIYVDQLKYIAEHLPSQKVRIKKRL
jgi:hypothetical protein